MKHTISLFIFIQTLHMCFLNVEQQSTIFKHALIFMSLNDLTLENVTSMSKPGISYRIYQSQFLFCIGRKLRVVLEYTFYNTPPLYSMKDFHNGSFAIVIYFGIIL